MADSTTTLISGPYGSERVPVPDVTDPKLKAGALSPEVDRVLLDDNRVAGDAGFSTARQGRETRAVQPDASIIESLGAAVNSWDTTRMIKRLGRPSFDDDAPIQPFEYLQELPMTLSEDEREYFLNTALGVKSADYAVQQIKDRRLSTQAVGDHPIASLGASFMDPLWLVVPPSVRLGKASPVAGRLAATAAGAAIGGAVTASGEGPVSDSEIAMSMVLNGAMAGVMYRPGKGLVPADPEFPVQRLDASIAAVQPAVEPKPRLRLVEPARYDDVGVPAVPAVFADIPAVAPPHMGTPRYKEFAVQFESELDKAAYIIGGRGQSAAHKEILQWAMTASGLTEAQLVSLGDTLRQDLKSKTQSTAAGTSSVSAMPGPYSTRTTRVEVSPAQPARTERRKVADARYEEIPPELQAGAVNTDPAQVVKAVDTAVSQDQKARGLGSKLMWNMHKTMSSFGDVGKKVANLIYDNNSDLSLTSMEAHREAIMSELRTGQYQYEDLLRTAMKEDGFGLGKMVNPMTSRQAYGAQARIEKEVQRELFRRDQMNRQGMPIASDLVPDRITKMTDALDAMHKKALEEMQSAGVAGSEGIVERPGYLNRRWSSLAIDNVTARLEAQGLTKEAAHSKVTGLVSLSLRRANGLDKKLSDQIGQAIVDRALRKGYFEDSLFNAPAGEGQLKELRDILKGGGMAAQDIERALDVLRVQSDDAGKAGFMKHRMDLDYRATMRVGDQDISVMDLIDGRVGTIVDQYVSQVSTQAAFARKGLTKRSDIEALREELLHSVPAEQRAQARDLFDNTIAHYRGDPNGAKINENFRLVQAYGRSISLAWSGLWQLTEFANAMGEYGLLKSMKYAAQEIPGFKQIMSPSKEDARSLNNVLAEHSSASMRMRPYIAKFEDGYEMDMGNALQLSAQTTGQMVPYANAMRYVHHYQAKIVGNLILDRMEQAAKGNTKAREALAKYGLEAPVMDKLKQQIDTHGFDVDAWDDAVWADARPAFAKMMDTAVLKGRLGDIPAFAAFDPVGKFVFTYRTFVLTAHNKVMAGTMERNGASAVGLVLLYQFPLAMAAVQAQAAVTGQGVLSPGDLTKKAMGQMGGLGLFSEPLKWATGESNSVGAPALIPIDRGVKLFQAGAQLDAKQGASAAMTMVPVISAVPFIRGMASQIKE